MSLINSNKVYLVDLIDRGFLNQIIMYKTWDNTFCRNICIEIISIIETENFDRNSPNVLKEKKIEFSHNVILKIIEEFLKLKELCEYGCIHKDLENLINKTIYSFRG